MHHRHEGGQPTAWQHLLWEIPILLNTKLFAASTSKCECAALARAKAEKPIACLLRLSLFHPYENSLEPSHVYRDHICIICGRIFHELYSSVMKCHICNQTRIMSILVCKNARRLHGFTQLDFLMQFGSRIYSRVEHASYSEDTWLA